MAGTGQQIIRPESAGGTPANRMIHRESQQLNIGPHFIDRDREVRVIFRKVMPGLHHHILAARLWKCQRSCGTLAHGGVLLGNG